MRYLITLIGTVAAFSSFANPVMANHRIERVALQYNDAIHVLADFAAQDHRLDPYVGRYLCRLDTVSEEFARSLIRDPFCPRTSALFEEVRSLHLRVEAMLQRSCRTSRGLRRIWEDADCLFVRLDRAFSDSYRHRREPVTTRRTPILEPIPPQFPRRIEIDRRSVPQQDLRYNLDRQRAEFKQNDFRGLNQRGIPQQNAVQFNTNGNGLQRLLLGLLN